MLAQERRNLIMKELHTNGIVKINELTQKFNVTVETARRDIAILQKKNLVKKIYGGAVLAGSTIKDVPLATRETMHAEEKAAIGKLAATLIRDQDTIILGSGTTTLQIAKSIKHLHNLSVITNSLPIILELSATGMQLFCTGGQIKNNDMNMTDVFSIEALKKFHVDIAFITALGVTQNAGVTCYTLEDAQFAKQVMAQASQTILAVDSSKFGNNSLVVQGEIQDYDTIITDSNIAPEYISELRSSDTNLMIAPL